MIDRLLTTADIIGILVLLFCTGAVVTAWAIDRHHERTPLFAVPEGRPAAGWSIPPPQPFPGDPEPTPAASKPAAAPQPAAEPDPADDTVWKKHQVEKVWELLNAEAVNSNG